MEVYQVNFKTDGMIGPWQEIDDCLEEIRTHLECMIEGTQTVLRITKTNMTQGEYNALPEFMGY